MARGKAKPLQASLLDRRTTPGDGRRRLDRWVGQKSPRRWAIRGTGGRKPKGSYGSPEAAIMVVIKRREARAQVLEARRKRMEAREAHEARNAAVRAQAAQRRREAFEVKKAAQVAKGRAEAVKLNETITNRIKRQRETARRNGI
jgi:hypothetical protein